MLIVTGIAINVIFLFYIGISTEFLDLISHSFNNCIGSADFGQGKYPTLYRHPKWKSPPVLTKILITQKNTDIFRCQY